MQSPAAMRVGRSPAASAKTAGQTYGSTFLILSRMADFLKLPAWNKDGALHVVVETPKGSGAKFKFDARLATFVYLKSLMLGLSYPYDWGFVPSTLAEDGDPLDAMVVHDAATAPGMVIPCRAIGVLQVRQTRKGKWVRNDRIIAIPTEAHSGRSLRSVRQVSPEVREELEKFFAATQALNDKELRFLGWKPASEAIKTISRSEKRYRAKARPLP